MVRCQHCCRCHALECIPLLQVDMAAAGRAAIQRRAPPASEAAALPGGSVIFAAAPEEGNRVLQEAAPISLLQVKAHWVLCWLLQSGWKYTLQ